MFNRLDKLILLLCVVISGTVGLAHSVEPPTQPSRPALGQPVAPAAVDTITVFQDGRGLPSGRGNVAQGKVVYQTHCLACHGPDGRDGINDNLAGAGRTIGAYWPYAPTLFDYVRRAMPYHQAGLLNAAETYAVVAYLLYLNGLWPEGEWLDAQTLPAVVMPNRKNFTSQYPLP
ncbi:MAG: cytochrome c [Pseudomonadota bacterium]